MINLLQSKKKIVINSDIDGILSGLMLQEFLGCEVVGFSNSADKLWISEDQYEYRKEFVFIDMFVAPENLACIDQHIVSFNEEHNKRLALNPQKINPNIIRGRYFSPQNSYFSKYPFGTVHFIIAELERNNIDLSRLSLFKEGHELHPIDFFLRADDALLTSVKNYPQNAKDWWNWLLKYSAQGNTTKQFIDYTYSGLNVEQNKRTVTQKLKGEPFYCEKSDGGFVEIADSENSLIPNFKLYVDYLAEITNLSPLHIPEKFKIVEGIAERTNFNNEHSETFVNESKILDKKIFSYAFVKSFGQENSLSYTHSLK